jgi:hypothetical protein
MVQLPSRHKLPALDEETQPIPTGASLWEMALQGRGASPPDEDASSSESGKPRFRRRMWILGVACVLVIAGVVGLFGIGKSTNSGVGTPGGAPGLNTGAGVSSDGTTSRQGSPCLAQPLVANPAVGATDEIVVGNVPHGAAVTIQLAYSGGSAQYSAAPTSTGYSDVPISVGSAPPSQPVEVSVTAGSSSCQTSFTPAASTPG